MDREKQLATELEALQSLCDPAASLADRQKLSRFLDRTSFLEPEHKVVFDSICALLPRGPFSEMQLRVHLTKRGFPDTDVEKYFPRAAAGGVQPKAPRNETP